MEAALFITRKLRGIGGMQRYNADLWSMFHAEHPSAYHIVLPRVRGSLRLIVLLVRHSRCTVHLGDAALSPIILLIRLVRPQWSFVVSACGLDVVYPKPWYQYAIRKSIARADRIVCISYATAQEVARRGVPRDSVVVIPPMIRRSVLAMRDRSQVPALTTVGRLIERKGVAWFIQDVLPRLLMIYPNLQYNVVGEGPDRSSIENAIRMANCRNNVLLHRALTDEQRDRLLLETNLFVAPNIHVPGDMEGFGIVCAEGSTRGVPVVASRLEGLQDAVIENVTGTFFEPENADECVSVICAALERSWDPVVLAEATQHRYGAESLQKNYRSLWRA